MHLIKRLDDRINQIELGLLILLLSVMVVFAFLQVVLREFFSTGLIWGDILLRQLVLWIGCLGGALATSNQRHIHIDALSHFMSPRLKAAVGIFTNLFGAAVCALLYQASLIFLQSEIESATMLVDQIPVWYAELIIPVGFGLHVVHFLVRAVLSAGEAIRKESAA